MNRTTIHPENEAAWLALRAQDLTSTDVPALFGLSPYKTLFELWHEKKSGERVAFTENERVKWGKRLEATVAQGIADDQDWHIRPMKEYMRLEGLRIGSSFDFRICANADGDSGKVVPFDCAAMDAILEIKCVDWLMFRDGWTIDEGFIEAPAHIEIQVQHQMLVSGLCRAYIGVMVGGNDIRVIEREADPDVHRAILAKCAEFWQSIDANEAPDPVMPDDAEAVIRMHQFAEPGKLFDARNDAAVASLVREYHQFGEAKKEAEEQQKVRKAELLQRVGDAEKVLLEGFSVSCGLVGPSAGTLVTAEMVGQYVGGRSGYRLFRVTPKKAKAAAA
jgi:putative phage-type endonuclease